MPGRLVGKVALIAGAAEGIQGRPMGIGGATAWLFTREGASVVVADTNEARGRQTAQQLAGSGAEAIFARLDVTNEADWRAAVQAALDRFGRLDVLVVAVGLYIIGRVEDTPVADWDRQMAVHANGAFLGAKHAIPAMRKSGGGSIVVISSTAGLVGSGFSAAYAAAKGASRIFTKAAAIQYARENIRVNSVHPGYCETPLALQTVREVREAGIGGGTGDPREGIPLARAGRAEDVASAVLFLASGESSYVTGAELVVDGGATAQ
ncbi:MAG: SDR family oxidoreductase [SAR202 cluster bacterium]|nr:SDR family oxidoreductase [SAR202 cluster bacterium]